jgi:hypothetical protein
VGRQKELEKLLTTGEAKVGPALLYKLKIRMECVGDLEDVKKVSALVKELQRDSHSRSLTGRPANAAKLSIIVLPIADPGQFAAIAVRHAFEHAAEAFRPFRPIPFSPEATITLLHAHCYRL